MSRIDKPLISATEYTVSPYSVRYLFLELYTVPGGNTLEAIEETVSIVPHTVFDVLGRLKNGDQF